MFCVYFFCYNVKDNGMMHIYPIVKNYYHRKNAVKS